MRWGRLPGLPAIQPRAGRRKQKLPVKRLLVVVTRPLQWRVMLEVKRPVVKLNRDGCQKYPKWSAKWIAR